MQGISLDQIEPLRILFGWFPTYKDSPLKTPFDRILQIGDASGIQSPLSFGGFGAMARHLSRLRRAVQEALQVCCIMPCHSCHKHTPVSDTIFFFISKNRHGRKKGGKRREVVVPCIESARSIRQVTRGKCTSALSYHLLWTLCNIAFPSLSAACSCTKHLTRTLL